jgi:transaldolase
MADSLALLAESGVNTMPAGSITSRYGEAERVLGELATVGMDYDDVVRTVEEQGVAKFDAAWEELGERLGSALARRPEQA